MTRPAPSPARRQRLLAAAEHLFSRHGYRAVTMAGIAAEAGLAKATAYAYFADKDEVFRAVAADVATRLVDAVRTGIEGAGTTAARLTAALRAKDLLLQALVTGSPHAGELFDARDRLVRAPFDDADAEILRLVAAALEDGVERGLPAERLARVLVRASRGLAARSTTPDVLAEDIGFLVARLAGG